MASHEQPSPENLHGGDVRAVAARLGIDHAPRVSLDFSVNVNPLGAPAAVAHTLNRAALLASRYPEIDAAGLEARLASVHGLSPDRVVAGNGSTECFGWILRALRPAAAAGVAPAYRGYREACLATGIPYRDIVASAPDSGFLPDLARVPGDVPLVFIGSPNNPTGRCVPPASILGRAAAFPRQTLVVDESFIDFLPDAGRQSLAASAFPPNVMVVKSLTKFFCIPGLRLGLAFAHPAVAPLIRAQRLPWNVNALAQEVGMGLYDDPGFAEESRTAIPVLRARLLEELASLPGFTAFPSDVNFILVRLPESWTASRIQRDLLKDGILIRSCEDFEGLGPRYIRLAVRPLPETDLLIRSLRTHMGFPAPPAPPPAAAALMVVGTTSSAGKSVVAAALCRHFSRRGRRVAPFKAQNMSLNSFVTPEGGEMGRAQVNQARAAGIEPHTDMNPVLLKPLGQAGCQVIVNGHPTGNRSAADYYAGADALKRVAHQAYDRLAARFELIVLEGAGSPAEINLLDRDFVNLSMAEHARAPALLVADIDRGGVFASIFGTLSLLPPSQRRLVRGIVINKFRGDPALLRDGLDAIEHLTGVPVLGVVPWIKDLDIDEEDSLGIDRPPRDSRPPLLDIAVVRLPFMSNFTDFLPLERTPGVRVRYVSLPRDLGQPDAVILPGTKHTRGDLAFLDRSGWREALLTLSGRQTPLLGICGGFQILGRRIEDPAGVEGDPGASVGLGLLAVDTVLESDKELAQVRGVAGPSCPFAPPGTPWVGYEIHMGRSTSAPGAVPALLQVSHRNGAAATETAGAHSSGGQVMGCYVHGLFDSEPLRAAWLGWLARRKPLGAAELAELVKPLEAPDAYDRVADLLERHVDMEAVEGFLA